MTGSVQREKIPRAIQVPGLRKCPRAGGQSAKKMAKQIIWYNALYLQKNASPIAKPTIAQSRVWPSGCTARQPAISAQVQHRTSGGSIVMRIEPAPSNGTALTTSRSQNAARAPISHARNPNAIRLRIAANNGEKKRTPSSLSPKRLVPANCIQAIPGGLL